MFFKDEILNRLAQQVNVAQFVSFGSMGVAEPRFSRINGFPPNTSFSSAEEAIGPLLQRSFEKTVNVRSYDPAQPKGHPFVYGLTNVADVIATVERNAASGLYSIVNETIDVSDGGVSGVALGNIIEFTPHDTPKGVDKPGVCHLPRKMGLDILRTVYGFAPEIDFPANVRVEFSVHPLRRGTRMGHTIIWELEEFASVHEQTEIDIRWPHNFSRHIGDKAFGLLVAAHMGICVPHTTVISRAVAPFTFGQDTGVSEVWIRTAPVDRTPGKFSTFKGWVDPFKLLSAEDPGQDKIAAVLCQQTVNPLFSGSLLTGKDNHPLIEGIAGRGDMFMVGQAGAGSVPGEIADRVSEVFQHAFDKLGPVEMEWVFDGERVWAVQLHKSERVLSYGNVIVPGTPASYIDFDVAQGLEALRALIDTVPPDTGIRIRGNVGITSHYGDVLRKAGLPSVIVRG